MSPIEAILTRPRGKPERVTLTSSEASPDLMKSVKVASGALAGGNANAYAFAWQNPESVQILVVLCYLRVTAAGEATSVIDVGSAGDATTHSDNLIDAGALDGTPTFYLNNINDGGTNGKAMQILDAKGGTTDYITGQILTANAPNLAGTYNIIYVPLS